MQTAATLFELCSRHSVESILGLALFYKSLDFSVVELINAKRGPTLRPAISHPLVNLRQSCSLKRDFSL